MFGGLQVSQPWSNYYLSNSTPFWCRMKKLHVCLNVSAVTALWGEYPIWGRGIPSVLPLAFGTIKLCTGSGRCQVICLILQPVQRVLTPMILQTVLQLDIPCILSRTSWSGHLHFVCMYTYAWLPWLYHVLLAKKAPHLYQVNQKLHLCAPRAWYGCWLTTDQGLFVRAGNTLPSYGPDHGHWCHDFHYRVQWICIGMEVIECHYGLEKMLILPSFFCIKWSLVSKFKETVLQVCSVEI